MVIINIDKRSAHLIVVLLVVLIGVAGVYAYNSGGPPSTVGHDLQELAIGNITYTKMTGVPGNLIPFNIGSWQTGSIGAHIQPGDIPRRAIIRVEMRAYWSASFTQAQSCPDVSVQFAPAGSGGSFVTDKARLTYLPVNLPVNPIGSITNNGWIEAHKEVSIPVNGQGQFDYLVSYPALNGITYTGGYSSCAPKLIFLGYERALPA